MKTIIDDFYIFRSENSDTLRTKTQMCDELVSLQETFMQTLSQKQMSIFNQLEPLWVAYLANKEKTAYKDGFCDGVALIKEALHGDA